MKCKLFKECSIRKFYKVGKVNKKWLEIYCHGDHKSCTRYQLKKIGVFYPDYILPNGDILK